MKRIGRYIVRGLLGRGGMAKVYKVELDPIGKIAALKLFDPDPLLVNLIGLDRLKALFIGETTTLARLQHPHIVSIDDFDEHRGRPFYVMGYAANNLGVLMGETYQVERPSRIIDVDKALRYTYQTLDGLSCLHDAGIIHRDIKPFNLLLSARDEIKICDFGLSKLRGETFSGPANLNVGSPYYAAPEQEDHPDQVGLGADIYPVGIMLYRMLTGRLPRTTPKEATYTPPSTLNPNLDQVWDQLVATAIDHRPENRYGSALDMMAAVEALISHWEQHKEKTCALMPEKPVLRSSEAKITRPCLCSTPIKIDPAKARHRFGVDPLWRPLSYVSNKFITRPGELVLDQATGLIWQQSGSPYPRSWQQAREYIEQLNADRFGGYPTWHLPTVSELLTLFCPVAMDQDLCIDPWFDTTQRWLWSADRRSFVAAYYADIELGFIGWQDFSAPFYVRAVCQIDKFG